MIDSHYFKQPDKVQASDWAIYVLACTRMAVSSTALYCIVFIHFYSASHSMSLSEALQTTAINTVLEFIRRSATGNCKWRTCPRYLSISIALLIACAFQKHSRPQQLTLYRSTWRLERDSNPRFSGRKADDAKYIDSTIRHNAPQNTWL